MNNRQRNATGRTTRRQYLTAALSSAAALGFAGCQGTTSNDGGGGTNDNETDGGNSTESDGSGSGSDTDASRIKSIEPETDFTGITPTSYLRFTLVDGHGVDKLELIDENGEKVAGTSFSDAETSSTIRTAERNIKEQQIAEGEYEVILYDNDENIVEETTTTIRKELELNQVELHKEPSLVEEDEYQGVTNIVFRVTNTGELPVGEIRRTEHIVKGGIGKGDLEPREDVMDVHDEWVERDGEKQVEDIDSTTRLWPEATVEFTPDAPNLVVVKPDYTSPSDIITETPDASMDAIQCDGSERDYEVTFVDERAGPLYKISVTYQLTDDGTSRRGYCSSGEVISTEMNRL